MISEAVWYAEQLDKSGEICSDYLFKDIPIDINKCKEIIDFRNKIMSKSKKSDIANYLNNPHEIMAYAWQIINEFKLRGESEENIKRLLRTNNFIKLKFSEILNTYHQTFKPESKILKKLYKYMAEYLTK